MTDKGSIREEMKKARDSISLEDREKLSALMVGHVMSLDEYKKAKIVCAYASHKKEVKTDTFIEQSLSAGKVVCVPIIQGGKLILSRIDSLSDLTERNDFGILEPAFIRSIKPEAVDLILVPGLSFSDDGHRIGYGKGYYDKLLHGYEGVRVGIYFQLQHKKEVPFDDADEAMNILITEKGVTMLRKGAALNNPAP